MNAHVMPLGDVVRFSPRLRVVPTSGNPTSALDALLSAGTIDDRQHAGEMWNRTGPMMQPM